MDLALQALIVGLAAWRISSLFTQEQGPFNIFTKIRSMVGIREAFGGGVRIPDTTIGGIFSCVWCFSVYASIALWFAYDVAPEPVFVVAAMSVAIVVNRITDK